MSKKLEVLAIIPARGGSKGLARKNVLPLAGKPVIAHTIDHALCARSVTRTVVSTDDDEIAEISRRFGAESVRRPAEMTGDAATSESALMHVLDHLDKCEGYGPDLVVFLQCTSPMRRADDIDCAVQKLVSSGGDSLFSAAPVQGFVWRLGVEGPASVSYDHRRRPRRQDAVPEVVENGSIYVFKPWVLKEGGNRLGGKIIVYEMDPLDSYQIDEPADLERITQLMSLRPPPAPNRSALGAVREICDWIRSESDRGTNG